MVSPRFIAVGLRACRATTSARTQPVDLALLGDELDARAALRQLLHELQDENAALRVTTQQAS